MQTILIIDDNTDYRMSLAEILRLELYYTLEAENGQSGLAMISEYLPDLILCDINMPIMSGIEMLVSMKQNYKTSSIPFIFVTAYTDNLTQEHMTGLGADLCLAKTVKIGDLIDFIYDLLNTPVVQ